MSCARAVAERVRLGGGCEATRAAGRPTVALAGMQGLRGGEMAMLVLPLVLALVLALLLVLLLLGSLSTATVRAGPQ